MTKYLVIENQDKAISRILPDATSITYGGQESDLTIHEWLKTNIADDANFEKIVIELRLGENDTDTGLRIANHIRLSEYGKTTFLPIYITSQDDQESIITEQLLDNNELTSLILMTKSCQLIKMRDLLSMESFDDKPLEGEEELVEEVLSKLRFSDVQDNRHQIANEWGVNRLAAQSGIKLENLNQPKTLFFKYLQKKYPISPKEEFKTFFKYKRKVLLIDDNWMHGWKSLIEDLFPAVVDSFSNINDFKNHLSKNAENYSQYNMVFLDFYLPEKADAKPNNSSTKALLIELKELNPAVPIIMFTASNKAWNSEELKDWGADGYFIKESPENADSEKFSIENFNNLKKTTRKAYFQGKTLKPFWEKSQNLFENIQINDKNARQRAVEMLRLAFNLLYRKKLSSFEENILKVNFTPYQLAFLTYWSVLNSVLGDIENEFDWEKRLIKNLKINGIEVVKNFNTWMEYIKKHPKEPTFNKKYPRKRHMQWYQKSERYDKKVTSQMNATAPIFFISAFILSQKEPKYHHDLMDRFITLNNIRNQLDFTHANPEIVKNEKFGLNKEMEEDCHLMIDFFS